MAKKIDGKKILSRLKKEPSVRGPVTVYLNLTEFERFKKICEQKDTTASRVLEELMKDFMASAK